MIQFEPIDYQMVYQSKIESGNEPVGAIEFVDEVDVEVVDEPKVKREQPNFPDEQIPQHDAFSSAYMLTQDTVLQHTVFTHMGSVQQTEISLALGLLKLRGSDITDESLEALLTNYPKLKILRLTDCPNITKTGLLYLNKLPLNNLQIKGCVNITEKELMQLPSDFAKKVHLI